METGRARGSPSHDLGMKILVDMNLSPSWVPALERHGWSAVHWADVCDPRAADRVIMDWAADHGYVVFTHDMDFGTMLALSHERSPSVLQIRAQDVLPIHLEGTVLAALAQHDADLSAGPLVVVDETRSRVRLLPI